ncbi:MAG TPA: S1C family serine protease [Candidatus Dojkabacteria bacterium]|nr:S1C family serine protease [Candidatus Dojkabacteria bacterium]
MSKKPARFLQIVSICAILISGLLAPIFKPVKAEEVVLGAADSIGEVQKSLLIAKPAVVQVTDIIKGEIIIQAVAASDLGAPSLSGMTYNFSFAFGGSGFFLTSDGYLVTNGHVAKPSENLIAYYGIAQQAEFIFKDALAAVLRDSYGVYDFTDAELDSAYQKAINDSYGGDVMNLVNELYNNFRQGYLKIEGIKRSNYIQTGAVAGSEKLVIELGKAATLIDTRYEGDTDSSDLALLKVEGSNFPTVNLGSSVNVQIGKEIYAIGYPAIVESGTGVFTDVESELEPSITKGIVSAKKKLVDGTEAFQTDAGISHGNSGGPVVDTDGSVIGVATWGFGDEPGGESFNFLISVEEVKKLLTKNNVQQQESITSKKWASALTNYINKCYSSAKSEFEEVRNLYKDNVDVDSFITKSQESISKGEDVCAVSTTTVLVVVVVVCLGLIIAAAVVVFILLKRRKKPTEEQPVASGTEKSTESEPKPEKFKKEKEV